MGLNLHFFKICCCNPVIAAHPFECNHLDATFCTPWKPTLLQIHTLWSPITACFFLCRNKKSFWREGVWIIWTVSGLSGYFLDYTNSLWIVKRIDKSVFNNCLEYDSIFVWELYFLANQTALIELWAKIFWVFAKTFRKAMLTHYHTCFLILPQDVSPLDR